MIKNLKEKCIQKGYSAEEVIDNVLIIKKFVSEEEIKDYFKIFEGLTQEDWETHYLDDLVRFCKRKFDREDVDNLIKEGKFQVTHNWKDKVISIEKHPLHRKISNRFENVFDGIDNTLEFNSFATVQRMYEGINLISHTDQFTDPSIKYAVILYLNDDYVDGELFFKNKNFQIRPEPGDILVFPGNEEYEHGVHPVGAGPIRYVLPAFIKIKNFYDNNKY